MPVLFVPVWCVGMLQYGTFLSFSVPVRCVGMLQYGTFLSSLMARQLILGKDSRGEIETNCDFFSFATFLSLLQFSMQPDCGKMKQVIGDCFDLSNF